MNRRYFGASPAARLVCDSLANDPDKWKPGHYHVDHESGLMIWIANGFWSVQPYTYPGGTQWTFTLVDKWHVWGAYKRWFRCFGSPLIQKLRNNGQAVVHEKLGAIE